jgi:hypothetical protein
MQSHLQNYLDVKYQNRLFWYPRGQNHLVIIKSSKWKFGNSWKTEDDYVNFRGSTFYPQVLAYFSFWHRDTLRLI